MELQDCLQELLHDDNTEQDGSQANYFDLVASKSQQSLLCFNGVKILPPILSDAEKIAMQEYRRKAVDMEQKLFETRRQNYSNLQLKVMDIMDRFQRNEEKNKLKIKTQERKNVQTEEEETTCKANQDDDNACGFIRISTENRGCYNNNNSRKERQLQDNLSYNTENDMIESSAIFQKPRLYNSSSPRRNRDNNSRSSEQSNPTLPQESHGTSGQLKNQSLDRESSSSRSSILRRSNYITKEMLDTGREISASDSLASTVLSLAFTDSSVASQATNMESTQHLNKPVHRQLDMDIVNHNLYQSYYHNVNPLTSTPNELQRPAISSSRVKKKAPVKQAAMPSIKKSTETYTEQDRALEKLEMMRKKLLEEKDKQISLIRQQELARLRKNRQKHFDLSEGPDIQSNMNPQEHFSSHPASDMYSIPERSFEGSLTLKEEDQNEVESASDKENNHYIYNPVFNPVVHHYKGEHVETASPTNRNITQGSFSTSPYMRKEFLKQFEVVKNQRSDGRDQFSILSAHSKGFITRRLLQTEKIQAIIKTIKDTSEFLAEISKEGTSSYQDKSLHQRVQVQLVAAKTKLHDIFFKIPVHARMEYITHSRNLAKEREERQYDKSQKSTRKLSSATLKAMQRRNGEQNENSELKRTSTQSPLGKRRNWDTRVLKPVQSTKSPQLQDKGRLVGRRRPGTASSPRHGIIKKNAYSNRPATAMMKQTNRKSISRRSIDNDNLPSHRSSRTSLQDKLPTAVKRVKSNEEQTTHSKLPVRKSLGGGLTNRVSKDEENKTYKQSNRPSRLSLEGTSQALVKQDTVKNNRPKTTSGTRKITRSMAARFDKS